MIMPITARFAAFDLENALPVGSQLRWAIGQARFWEGFPNAYTREQTELGQNLIIIAPQALEHFNACGKVPAEFATAARVVLAACVTPAHFYDNDKETTK